MKRFPVYTRWDTLGEDCWVCHVWEHSGGRAEGQSGRLTCAMLSIVWKFAPTTVMGRARIRTPQTIVTIEIILPMRVIG